MYVLLNTGATGPRGPKGVPGNDGHPGVPGIVAWKITERDEYNPNITNYLIAPSIAGKKKNSVEMYFVNFFCKKDESF